MVFALLIMHNSRLSLLLKMKSEINVQCWLLFAHLICCDRDYDMRVCVWCCLDRFMRTNGAIASARVTCFVSLHFVLYRLVLPLYSWDYLLIQYSWRLIETFDIALKVRSKWQTDMHCIYVWRRIYIYAATAKTQQSSTKSAKFVLTNNWQLIR